MHEKYGLKIKIEEKPIPSLPAISYGGKERIIISVLHCHNQSILHMIFQTGKLPCISNMDVQRLKLRIERKITKLLAITEMVTKRKRKRKSHRTHKDYILYPFPSTTVSKNSQLVLNNLNNLF